MTLTEQIHKTIEELKSLPIIGCITGSSMIPDANFDEWDSHPDIDVFVYYEQQLQWTVAMLLYEYGFKMLDSKEDWKLSRLNTKGTDKKNFLTTLKVKRDDVIVNITYKKNRNNIVSVLASFDMSCIMIGYDIPYGWGIDMRTSDVKIFDDKNNRWSSDPKVSVPNPMRKQDADIYTTEMWVRQFDRVIKYWNRGIDTRPMAQFYIDLITQTIEKGALFTSETALANYNEFVETYEPLREKMILWLADKEEC